VASPTPAGTRGRFSALRPATHALAQFIDDSGISGPSPGLENAAATTFNLENPATGDAGGVITNSDNGPDNESLATLNTVANLVAVCSPPSSGGRCAELLDLAKPPRSTAAGDTVEVVLNLAKNPTVAPAKCRRLHRRVA
jgi:hypothetical protein